MKNGDDVLLDLLQPAPAVCTYNVRAGAAPDAAPTDPLIVQSPAGPFRHAGAVPAAPSLLFYKVYAASCCGGLQGQ